MCSAHEPLPSVPVYVCKCGTAFDFGYIFLGEMNANDVFNKEKKSFNFMYNSINNGNDNVTKNEISIKCSN